MDCAIQRIALQGEGEDEAAALAGRGLDGGTAAVGFDQAASDGDAESRG